MVNNESEQPKLERRINEAPSNDSIYKISDINQAIDSERRGDELDRLREVNEQKKTWFRVFSVCTAAMVGLMILAIVGMFK
jgi:hypothetical protein